MKKERIMRTTETLQDQFNYTFAAAEGPQFNGRLHMINSCCSKRVQRWFSTCEFQCKREDEMFVSENDDFYNDQNK